MLLNQQPHLLHIDDDRYPMVSPLNSTRSEISDIESLHVPIEKLQPMNFNSLIKRNPFEKDVKLYKNQHIIESTPTQQSQPQPNNIPLSQIPEKAKVEQIRENHRMAQTPTTRESRFQTAEKILRRPGTTGTTNTNGTNDSRSPSEERVSSFGTFPKGILKVGNRSKYSQDYGYYRGFYGNSATFGSVRKRSNSRSNSPNEKARKRGFFISNSFDAANSRYMSKSGVVAKASSFKSKKKIP